MAATVSFTVKMSKQTKEALKSICEADGFKINKFIEKAVLHEIEREKHKEELMVFENYEKYGIKKAVDYRKFAKERGLKL